MINYYQRNEFQIELMNRNMLNRLNIHVVRITIIIIIIIIIIIDLFSVVAKKIIQNFNSIIHNLKLV